MLNVLTQKRNPPPYHGTIELSVGRAVTAFETETEGPVGSHPALEGAAEVSKKFQSS